MNSEELVRLIADEPSAHLLLRDAMLDVPYQLAEVFVCKADGSHHIRYRQVKDHNGHNLIDCGPGHADAQLNIISPANPLWKLMRHSGYFRIEDIRERNNVLGEKEDYLLRRDSHYSLLEQAYRGVFKRSGLRGQSIPGLKDVTFFRLQATSGADDLVTVCFRFFNAPVDDSAVFLDITEEVLRLQARIVSRLCGMAALGASRCSGGSSTSQASFPALKTCDAQIGRNVAFLGKATQLGELLIRGNDAAERAMWAREVHYSANNRDAKFVLIDASEDRLAAMLFGTAGSSGPALYDPNVRTIFIDRADRLTRPEQEQLVEILSTKQFNHQGLVKSCDIRGRRFIFGTPLSQWSSGHDDDPLAILLVSKTLVLPPLRERSDHLSQIDLLVRHVAKDIDARLAVETTSALRTKLAKLLLKDGFAAVHAELLRRISELPTEDGYRRILDDVGAPIDEPVDRDDFGRQVFHFFQSEVRRLAAEGSDVKLLDYVNSWLAQAAISEESPSRAAATIGVSMATLKKYLDRNIESPQR